MQKAAGPTGSVGGRFSPERLERTAKERLVSRLDVGNRMLNRTRGAGEYQIIVRVKLHARLRESLTADVPGLLLINQGINPVSQLNIFLQPPDLIAPALLYAIFRRDAHQGGMNDA